MNTIDKVLLEWSLKTDKGYPDINSKEDMDLFESMFGIRLNEEEESKEEVVTKKDIIDLINSSNLDDKQIRKLYQRVQGFHAYRPLKNHLGVKKYDDILAKKFTREIQAIIEDLDSKDTEKFIDYLNPTTNKQVSFPTGEPSKGHLKNIITKTGLPTSILNAVSKHASQDKGRLGVGMGELGISILFKNIINSPNTGDLGVTDGEKVSRFEVKGENGKIGESPRDFEGPVAELLEKYGFKDLGNKYYYNGTKTSKQDFAKVLSNIYNNAEAKDKVEIKNGMDSILRNKVGLPIDMYKIDYTDPKSIQNQIALANFHKYAVDKKFKHFIAHDYGAGGSNSGEYIYVTGTPVEMAKQLKELGARFEPVYGKKFEPRIGYGKAKVN